MRIASLRVCLPHARVCLVLLAVLFGGSVGLADEWPQFRGPNGSGRYEGEKPLPTTWSADGGIRWQVELPGRGASSPAVYGDRLVVTAYTGYGLDAENVGDPADLRLHVLCFDRHTGEKEWQTTFAGGGSTPAATPRRIDHGFATPTAALDASGVYVYFGVNGLYALDWDGSKRWEHRREAGTKGFGTATSPILHGTLVIQNQSIEGGPLAAFDKVSGQQQWAADGIDAAWSTPTILLTEAGDPELVMNHKNRVRGFNPNTGEELWSCEGIDDYVVPVVVGDRGRAYCFGGRQNRTLAIRLGGRGDVTVTHREWMVTRGANVTSPVLHENKLFCVHDKALWLVLDATDGREIVRERLPYRSRVYPSLVYGDGKLYAQTRDAGLLVLKAQTQYEELAANVLEPETLWNAGPALVDGTIYLRSDAFLYAIGEK